MVARFCQFVPPMPSSALPQQKGQLYLPVSLRASPFSWSRFWETGVGSGTSQSNQRIERNSLVILPKWNDWTQWQLQNWKTQYSPPSVYNETPQRTDGRKQVSYKRVKSAGIDLPTGTWFMVASSSCRRRSVDTDRARWKARGKLNAEHQDAMSRSYTRTAYCRQLHGTGLCACRDWCTEDRGCWPAQGRAPCGCRRISLSLSFSRSEAEFLSLSLSKKIYKINHLKKSPAAGVDSWRRRPHASYAP